jgi:hypothetical protein
MLWTLNSDRGRYAPPANFSAQPPCGKLAFARDERVRRPGDVLRGGSWNNNEDNASALARLHNWNNNRNDNNGFRVVGVAVVHFLPSLLWRGRAHAPRGRSALHSRPGSGNVGAPRTSGPPTEAKEKKGAGFAWSARSD